MANRLLTEKQMAAMLQCGTSTVRRYAAAGVIGRFQPNGAGCLVRYYLFNESDPEYIRQHDPKPEARDYVV